MALDIQALIIDANDPSALASFWEQALGWRRTYEAPEEIVIEPPEHSVFDGIVPDLLFTPVREGKTTKNRLHLDLRPDDQALEVERLLALGATHADVGQDNDKVGWVVLADPEGNEFCVLSPFSAEQRAELEAIRAARLPAG
jgi:hypothetical protein